MKSISVFLDIAIFADFQRKNGDVSRTHRVCLYHSQMILIAGLEPCTT